MTSLVFIGETAKQEAGDKMMIPLPIFIGGGGGSISQTGLIAFGITFNLFCIIGWIITSLIDKEYSLGFDSNNVLKFASIAGFVVFWFIVIFISMVFLIEGLVGG